VNSVTAGNGFITIGGTVTNPTVGLNTTASDARYLQLSGGTMSGAITFAGGQTFPGTGTVTSVNTGAGLTGGPITSTGSISIAAAGITNAMLANPSVTLNTGSGLSGGGALALGGSLTLANTGVLSVGASSPLASSGGANPSISLSGIVPIANGGTGIATAPSAAAQYLRSSGVGTWAVAGIQASDVPSLSSTYVDLISDQTVAGNKTFSNTISGNISGNAATATIANDTLALGGNPAASYNTTMQNDARYLQLAGGTLLGALNGTTASFTGDIQTGGAFSAPIPNDGDTGTVLNQLVELTGDPSAAVNAGTDPAVGTIGIVIGGAGTTGQAQVALFGGTSCVFDGATVAGDYVVKSTTVEGNCHDAGAAYPTGVQVVGRALTTNAIAGTYGLALFPTEERSNAGTVTGVTAGDSSITIGGTAAAPTVAVASNGITNANIADGSISPAKITGTAATLGGNSFTGDQSITGGVTATLFSGDGSDLAGINAGNLGSGIVPQTGSLGLTTSISAATQPPPPRQRRRTMLWLSAATQPLPTTPPHRMTRAICSLPVEL